MKPCPTLIARLSPTFRSVQQVFVSKTTRTAGKASLSAFHFALAILITVSCGSISRAQETKTLEKPAQKSADKEAKADKDGWIALLPEKGLEGWTITDFYGHGEVKREGELLVLEPGKPLTGSYWLVPPSLYGEIRQDAVLLKTGEKNPAAKALLDFLRGDAARQTIRDYGYGL